MIEATRDAVRPRDDAENRRVLLRLSGIVALGYGLGASMQSAYIYSRYVPDWSGVSVWSRILANLVAVVVLVAVLWALRVYRWPTRPRLLVGVLVSSGIAAVCRVEAQMLLGVYDEPDGLTIETELVAGLVIAGISAGIGAWGLVSRGGGGAGRGRAARGGGEVEHLLEALEAEEVRVRREVAEGLHGTLQGKLVVVDAHLTDVIARLRDGGGPHDDVAALEWVQHELDVVRELDVRQMSRLLYPERLELGLVPAVRALVGRLPMTIASKLVVAPQVREVDDPELGSLTTAQRLLAVRVVEEGVTNALKFGPPSKIVVELDVVNGELVVAVENDGQPLDPTHADPDGGTARLASRLHLVRGTVTLEPLRPKGVRLEARLPL